MRHHLWLTCTLVCAALLVSLAHVHAEPLENEVRDPTQAPQLQAQGLCFERAVAFGSVVVGGGCYEPYLVRTRLGSFLALVAPTSSSPVIAPGQTVLLDALEGFQVWSRLRHLVAFPVPLTTIPVNGLHAVTVRIDGPASRMIVPVPGTGPIAIGFAYR